MPKTRMQILLDPEAKKMLEREASARKISVGQVIREAVELYGKEKMGDEKELTDKDPIWDIVGLIANGESDLSEEHDHYLYGTLKKKQSRK
jgi:hypothetical protein